MAFWPIGYPLLLSGLYWFAGGAVPFLGWGLQILLGALSCLLLYLIGREVFNEPVGRLAGLMLALYPNHIYYTSLHLTEPLFAFLMLLATFLLLRSLAVGLWAGVAVGAVLGAAALTRPVIVLFSTLLPFWYFAQQRTWRRSLAMGLLIAGVSVMTISPWLVRNHSVTGKWTTLSTTGGFIFWLGNHPQALGGSARPKNFNLSFGRGSADRSQQGYQRGLDAIRREPVRSMLRGFQKLTYFVALETDGAMWNLKDHPSPRRMLWMLLFLFLANAAYLSMLGLSLLGWLDSPWRNPMKALLALLLLYMAGIVFVFIGDPRYHFFLVPFILLFSSLGFHYDKQGLKEAFFQKKKWARKKVLWWSTGMLTLTLMIAINLWLKYLEFRFLSGG